MPDDNPCLLFPGEVFNDADGVYKGDFAYGDGPGGPFGWVSCMSFDDPMSFFACFRYFTRSYGCEDGRPHGVAIGVPFAFGAGKAYSVADSSGPVGLEAMPAMRIDLPGSPEAYVGWAGAQVMDETTGEWSEGVLTGTTGWHPESAETWVFSCWAKLVPDINDVIPSGVKLRFDVAPNGFGAGSPTGEQLTLTDEWQFYQVMFGGGFFPDSSFFWPLLNFTGAENIQPDFCKFFDDHIAINTYAPLGSVLIKCAHLYPPILTGGNWIDSFHGNRP